MGGIFLWIEQNWFSVVQAGGIIGSILLSVLMLRRDQRTRRVSDLLTLAGHHRDLWADMHRRPELSRIAASEADLVGSPITIAEEEFLLLVIMHFYTGWMLAREGSLITFKTLATDAGSFFALPLPSKVWSQSRSQRDPDFVRFVDEAVGNRSTTTPTD